MKFKISDLKSPELSHATWDRKKIEKALEHIFTCEPCQVKMEQFEISLSLPVSIPWHLERWSCPMQPSYEKQREKKLDKVFEKHMKDGCDICSGLTVKIREDARICPTCGYGNSHANDEIVVEAGRRAHLNSISLRSHLSEGWEEGWYIPF